MLTAFREGRPDLKSNHIVRSVFSVTGLIILSKLMGFVKQMVVANQFGTTIETDLITLSEGFIGNIQYLLVQALVTSFISVYIHTRERDEEHASRFAMDTIKAFTMVAAGVTAVVCLGAPWIARLIAPSYSTELSHALAGYLRIFSPLLILFVWIAVFQALLTANKRFVPGEMVNFNQSAIIIVLVLAFHKTLGVNVLALAFFAYTMWNTVYLGVLSRRDWRLASGNPFANETVRQLLRMIVPLLLGYSIVYVNQMVDKILVSGLDAGTVTALGYAAVLSNLVTTFIASFGSILFSYVTTRISQGQHRQAAELSSWTASILMLLFLPISILTILCAEDIVTIVFARGAFGADSVRTAALALTGYAFTFVPMVLREVYSRFQYGYQDSRRPMVNSSIGIAANIALSIALCPRFGVLGVTFASSVSVCICGILNLLSARRHNVFLRPALLLRQLPLLAAGGAVCALIAVWGLRNWAESAPLVRFILVTICGIGGYLLTVSPLLWRLLKKSGLIGELRGSRRKK